MGNVILGKCFRSVDRRNKQLFEIRNVFKQYSGEFALNNISFTMGTGLNLIVGASGTQDTPYC